MEIKLRYWNKNSRVKRKKIKKKSIIGIDTKKKVYLLEKKIPANKYRLKTKLLFFLRL